MKQGQVIPAALVVQMCNIRERRIQFHFIRRTKRVLVVCKTAKKWGKCDMGDLSRCFIPPSIFGNFGMAQFTIYDTLWLTKIQTIPFKYKPLWLVNMSLVTCAGQWNITQSMHCRAHRWNWQSLGVSNNLNHRQWSWRCQKLKCSKLKDRLEENLENSKCMGQGNSPLEVVTCNKTGKYRDQCILVYFNLVITTENSPLSFHTIQNDTAVSVKAAMCSDMDISVFRCK